MRMAWVSFAALILSGCCGDGQCDGVDGEVCSSSFDCAGSCIDGVCRERCSEGVACAPGRTCWDDGTTTSAVCLPPPASDERWVLRADGLGNAAGRAGELTEPDDFICFGLAGVTLCSQEETGRDVVFDREFSTPFTTEQLSDVSVTVFDSNQVFPFGGCEGNCSTLQNIDRQIVYGDAFDLRPTVSRRPMVWDIPTEGGMNVRFSILPR